MPAIEEACRKQKAMLWAYDGVNRYGQSTVSSTGTEIKVRWENDRKQTLDPNGNIIAVDAVVVVGQVVTIGSIMWLGAQSDLPSDLIPTSNIMQVVSYASIPDIKGRDFYKEVGLVRFTDTLPTSS